MAEESQEISASASSNANLQEVQAAYALEIDALVDFLDHLDLSRGDIAQLLVNTSNKTNREKRFKAYREIARMLAWRVRSPLPPAVEAVFKRRWPEVAEDDYVCFQPGMDQEQWNDSSVKLHRDLVLKMTQERDYDVWKIVLNTGQANETGDPPCEQVPGSSAHSIDQSSGEGVGSAQRESAYASAATSSQDHQNVDMGDESSSEGGSALDEDAFDEARGNMLAAHLDIDDDAEDILVVDTNDEAEAVDHT